MKTLNKVLNFFGTNDTKLVLSLDGGGVRAIAQVIFLQELERSIGKPTHEIFDFFLVPVLAQQILHALQPGDGS